MFLDQAFTTELLLVCEYRQLSGIEVSELRSSRLRYRERVL